MTAANEILSKIHKVSLYILLAFDKVCRENNLTYFLDSGTALGAIRHGGFIPWDDDIDVGMPREDYERFLQIGQEKLPEEFFIQTRETDPAYKRNAAKIRLKGTTFQESEGLLYEQNGFFIDIFPYDNVSKNRIKAKSDIFIKGRLHYLISSWWYGGNGSSKLHRIIVKLIVKRIPKSLIEYLNKIFINSCRKNEYRDTGYMTSYYWVMSFNHSYIFDTEKLLPVKDIMFEGHPVKIMNCPDYYLKMIYGNYMQLPPEEKRHGHHLNGAIDFGKYI